MKLRVSAFAVSLILISSSNGQNLLYFSELNDNFSTSLGTAAFVDGAAHGTATGSMSVVSTTTNNTAVPGFTILASSASPAGGNYIIGPANGQNSIRVFSVSLAFAVDDVGATPTYVNGQDYEVIFWTKPSLFQENGDGQQWAYIPSTTTYQFVTGAAEGNTFAVSGWSPYTWTEVRVPFTYIEGVTNLSEPIDVVAPSPDTLTQFGGTGGSAPLLLQSNTRLWQLDYGIAPPIPEPSAVALCGMATLVLLRRRRVQLKIGMI